MSKINLHYEEGARYTVRERIGLYWAAFKIPDTDEIINRTNPYDPNWKLVGHAAEVLNPGDVVTANKKTYDNGLVFITLSKVN